MDKNSLKRGDFVSFYLNAIGSSTERRISRGLVLKLGDENATVKIRSQADYGKICDVPYQNIYLDYDSAWAGRAEKMKQATNDTVASILNIKELLRFPLDHQLIGEGADVIAKEAYMRKCEEFFPDSRH